MTRWAAAIFLLAFVLLQVCQACGPGRGVGRNRKPRKLTPLVFKQHYPNIQESIVTASGPAEGRIDRNDSRFKDLVPNYNQDIIFRDEEGTGADRLMTQRCKERLNTLAVSVMNQWPGVKLYVFEGWDEEGFHKQNSLHYEGRAVDIATSDRDKAKYGMLARLAIEAGFDWVYYESRSHIHCSVKLESSSGARYGGCFPGESTVTVSTGQKKTLSDLRIGEKVLSRDPRTNKLVFSEVILFLDYDPLQKKQFLRISLASGRTLTVTPTHLVFIKYSRNVRTEFAENIKIGDVLLVSDSNANIIEDSVEEIEGVIRTGVYAPLTEIGTVVVNDIVVSCYATVDSQTLADWAFLPLRLVWNVERSFVRLWNILSKPLGVWSRDSNTSVTITRNVVPVGVHWYAKVLYNVADYFIPSHLREG